MSQKSNKNFINEIYSKGPKHNSIKNKTDVYHTNDIWILDILDLKDYGPQNNRGYRYVLIVIDKFRKFGCTRPLKNKIAVTIKDSFEKKFFDKFKKRTKFDRNRSRKVFL